MSGTATTDTIAVTVHGTRGAVDLVVPLGATVSDVAGEYARQARLTNVPVLLTSTGRRLASASDLAAEGLVAGDVLVATHQVLPPESAAPAVDAVPHGRGHPGVTAWFVAAGVCAGVAGVVAARFGDDLRYSAALVLLVAAVMGVLPVGRYVAQRGAVTPAFAGGFGFAAAFEPGDAGLPLAVGVAALAAAVCAGVARAIAPGRVEVYDVWIAAGLATFLVAGAGVLVGAPPQVVWAVLLVTALLAARFVPALAIDVPDQLLIDLERLAVSAWSARDRTTGGKRGRTMVPRAAVAELLARGSRLVTAAAAGSALVTLVAVPALLGTATTEIDREGALALVFLVGGGFLLAARSHRHTAARVLLRLAGIWCWAGLAATVLSGASGATSLAVAVGALVVALCVVPVALATGRGWRSVWWARWAEIAEALCGALALGSLVVASGLFRMLWE